MWVRPSVQMSHVARGLCVGRRTTVSCAQTAEATEMLREMTERPITDGIIHFDPD